MKQLSTSLSFYCCSKKRKRKKPATAVRFQNITEFNLNGHKIYFLLQSASLNAHPNNHHCIKLPRPVSIEVDVRRPHIIFYYIVLGLALTRPPIKALPKIFAYLSILIYSPHVVIPLQCRHPSLIRAINHG